MADTSQRQERERHEKSQVNGGRYGQDESERAEGGRGGSLDDGVLVVGGVQQDQ
jgi:hypothetical protein